MKTKKLFGVLLITIFVLLFIKFNGIEELESTIKHIKLNNYIYLIILQIITILATAFIWYFIVNKEFKISFLRILQINLSSTFVESVTPSSKLGGEGAKIYLLKKFTNLNYSKLTSKVIVQKYIMFTPFLLMSAYLLIYSLFKYNLPNFIFISFLIITLTFLLIFLLIKYNMFNFELTNNNYFFLYINKFCNFLKLSIKNIKKEINKNELIFLFFISGIIWFLYPVKIFLSAKMLEFDISLSLVFVMTFSAYCVSMIPLTPGGLGTFEATIALIASMNGLNFSEGIMIALVARTITFWFPLILSIFASISIIFRKNNNIEFNKFEKKEEVVI